MAEALAIGATRPAVCPLPEVEMVGCFVFSPLRNTVIYRSFMCLVSFSILPLDLSGSSQSDPTSVF
jgi:hypothetical protein